MSLRIFRTVIGIDPGSTTGLARLDLDGFRDPVLTQATDPAQVITEIERLIGAQAPEEVLLAAEQFVVGPRAGRSSTPSGGKAARLIIGSLVVFAAERGITLRLRPAVVAKKWATDHRLREAGLYVKGAPHARDAARHALYAAVADGRFPDPLSSRARSPR